MVKSSTASRLGIPNVPTARQTYALRMLCENVLEPLRVALGRPVVVTSGFRSADLNRVIGGAKHSQHLDGEAADIECPGISNLELVNAIIVSRSIRFDRLILEFHTEGLPSSGWVHVSFASATQRREIFHAKRVNGETKYLIGLGRKGKPQ